MHLSTLRCQPQSGTGKASDGLHAQSDIRGGKHSAESPSEKRLFCRSGQGRAESKVGIACSQAELRWWLTDIPQPNFVLTSPHNGLRAAPGPRQWQLRPDRLRVKAGLAQMLKGGVIMDVVNAEQILEAIGIDYIDESEVLTPADHLYHVIKHPFKAPFVCGCRNLGEALRRIQEGAAMIRTKGEAGTGDVVEAVKHMRTVNSEIARARSILTSSTNPEVELRAYARELECSYELLKETAEKGRLPVVNFAAGGVATPADAALMMQLGCDGVFVGSGIFKSGDPRKRARAIVQAVTHYNDAKKLAELSENLGEAMVGISVQEMSDKEKLAKRGW
ncbi:pyridoxine biosynthesis protein PDX1 [Coccidioides immitis RMSCC 3703]|uniref:pyridoxal 5'-phosphate synthase (glutamine hydrolyzing) n=1 Tax=Coccidioides immitis RMSCC 3703 TaxID=454286 RepID=A0A0J8R915_COCIT|nr:pyridoxine biosynthesis protein PDX1 [Coccidioides immitis RMSCC 3703]